jgi:S1-C subfamily serine protease
MDADRFSEDPVPYDFESARSYFGFDSRPAPPEPELESEPPNEPPIDLRHDPSRRRFLTLAGTAGLAVLAGGAGGWLATRAAKSSTTATKATASTTTNALARTVSDASNSGEFDVPAVLALITPSVVSIVSTVTTNSGPFSSSGQAAGTGIIISSDGHVLTNAHVVEGGTDIKVTIDGSTIARAATLVASDAGADLALLHVTGASNLTAVTLGHSSAVVVGDDVIAIGNALALEGGLTVTKGIVSALDRTISTDTETLKGMIQTDASISSGNSGGPLVNKAGAVIGINTAAATTTTSAEAENIGFAIPIDTARPVLARLQASAA